MAVSEERARIRKAEVALQKLRALLDEEALEDGTRLPPERDLAAQLSVSRRALRQGLGRLEAEGRIWRRQGGGTFIGRRPLTGRGPPHGDALSLISDRTNPVEVMEVRLELEPSIAGLAAMRASAAEVQQIAWCLEKSESALDLKTFEIWDERLHRAIAQSCHNSLLLALFEAVNAVRRQTAWGSLQQVALAEYGVKEIWSQHARVVHAIVDRDSVAARNFMRDHVRAVSDAMRRSDQSTEIR